MGRGEGGGVAIVFGGYHSLLVSGEKRQKLTQPIEIDAHLTKKPLRDEARAQAEKRQKRPKLPRDKDQAKVEKKPKAKLSKAKRKAESEARKRSREAAKKVIVVRRVGREIKSVRKIGPQSC